MNILPLLLLLPLPWLVQGKPDPAPKGMTTKEFLAELATRSRDKTAPPKVENFKIEDHFRAPSPGHGKIFFPSPLLSPPPSFLPPPFPSHKKTISHIIQKYMP